MLLHNLFIFNIIVLIYSQNICVNKETCNECIQEPNCAWCAAEEVFSSPRCFLKDDLVPNKCPPKLIEFPKSESKIIQNNQLQLEANQIPIQMQPQIVNLKLRKGEEFSLPFKFAQARNFPIDLYFLMDLSASMKVHKNNLAALGTQLVNTMTKITSNFKIGFGSFVDKTDMPFVSTVPSKLRKPCSGCAPPYSFKNHMSLSDGATFANEVKKAEISGNLDSPEGGFDALMQAMVCKEEIGWREQARHIIVFSTDAASHIAGDGKLAGIIEPNDGKCHMANNSYTHALKQDYPSISHINYVASEGHFNIFFTISDTSGLYSVYNKLKSEIANSNIAKLSRNSDLSQLLVDYYNALSGKIQLKDDANSDIDIHYESDCPSPIPNGCESIKVGETINFVAKIKALQCMKNATVIIQPNGLSESLIVNLDVICDCKCEQRQGNVNEMCHNNGYLQCGICSCSPGHYGKTCECNGDNDFSKDVSSCRNNNETEVCSGLGTCKCGVCECEKRQDPSENIYGKYCECDNYSCPKSLDKLCNGNGNCECGTCACHAGWTGDSCACSNNNETCTKYNQVCSDKGSCVCGECRCESGYYGKYCEECTTCTGRRCDELKHCAKCKVFNTGDYKEDCDLKCAQYSINKVDEITDIDSDEIKVCRIQEECILTFKYQYINDQDIGIDVQKELQCPTEIDVLALVFGLIGGILLAGIVALLIWKIATDIHDKREYSKFENERAASKWNSNVNPLFKTPVGKYENPTYNG